MTTDLLPCPFCGSTNLRAEFSGSQGYIECNECGVQGPCDERAADPICDFEAAYEAWNRRAVPPQQPQPAGPSDEELDDLWLELYGFHEGPTIGDVEMIARAVLDRWGSPTR